MAASSNREKISMIKETAYGVTPNAGNFIGVPFTNESLNGNTQVVDSAIIRSDRYVSSQIVTGIDVGGSVGTELQDSDFMKNMLNSALLNDTWDEFTQKTASMTLSTSAGTLTRTAGSFITDGVKEGDFIKLSGYVKTANNVVYLVTNVEATVLNIVVPTRYTETSLNPVNEAGSANTKYKVLDKLTIGTDDVSFTVQKQFTDLVAKAIVYRGMLVNTMSLTWNYGEVVTTSFDLVGKDYRLASGAANLATNNRQVGALPTTATFNGSVDADLKAVKADNAWAASGIQIKNLSLTLNNNYQPLNELGEKTAVEYAAGTAKVEVTMDTFLNDDMWSSLNKKETQDPISVAAKVTNGDGTYGIYLPHVQVTFGDPASGGPDELIMVNMTGVATVGDGGLSPLIMYRDPAA